MEHPVVKQIVAWSAVIYVLGIVSDLIRYGEITVSAPW